MLLLAAALGQATAPRTPPVVLQDQFGRDLAQVGVTLVDWEGRIANPAIRLRLVPGPRLYLPARIRLSASGERLMFDLWSEVGPNGPTKTLFLESDRKPATFYMSTFPDTDGEDERHTLKVEVTDANESTSVLEFPIRVLDQDRPRRGLEFGLELDFGQDKSGFFADSKPRELASTAAADWAYFLAAMPFDPVPAEAEKTFVFDSGGFATGREVRNPRPYTGTLLYFVGIAGPEKRSGAAASDRGGFHTVGGRRTGLRRSGTVAMETTGNYNGMGWLFLEPDREWWKAGNMATMTNDFYSIVRHELGHALAFHRVHPAFDSRLENGAFSEQTLRRYLGQDPKVAEVEHFPQVVDPVSRVGVFGNEYGGDMPRKRWLITKADLLVLQAVGYRLRETSPFERLNFEIPNAPVKGTAGRPLVLDLSPTGGIPTYEFKVFEGALPPGLTLDSWTGKITGTPKAFWDKPVTIQLRDNDPTRSPVLKTLKFAIGPGEHEQRAAR